MKHMASHALKVIIPESFRGPRAGTRIFIHVRGELCSLSGGGGGTRNLLPRESREPNSNALCV